MDDTLKPGAIDDTLRPGIRVASRVQTARGTIRRGDVLILGERSHLGADFYDAYTLDGRECTLSIREFDVVDIVVKGED